LIVLRDPQHTGGSFAREVHRRSLQRPLSASRFTTTTSSRQHGEVVSLFRYYKSTPPSAWERPSHPRSPAVGGATPPPRAHLASVRMASICTSALALPNIEIEKDHAAVPSSSVEPDGKKCTHLLRRFAPHCGASRWSPSPARSGARSTSATNLGTIFRQD